jgi:hypothetical protein
MILTLLFQSQRHCYSFITRCNGHEQSNAERKQFLQADPLSVGLFLEKRFQAKKLSIFGG